MFRIIALATLIATPALAGPPAAPFASIDGGSLSFDQWQGRPVLVANTASLCGFTPQYDALQALQDTYAAQGLVVLAVPSDDFRQELGSAGEVKEFCEVNFDLTLPMTDITPVKGAKAHPFYTWVKAETGFAPNWNFNKVLIDAQGRVAGTWRSGTDPMSAQVRAAVEAAFD